MAYQASPKTLEAIIDSALSYVDMTNNRLEASYHHSVPPTPKSRRRGGSKPPAPEPNSNQVKILMTMQREGRTQVSIADALGVPRSRVRIWYRRRGLEPLPRLEGHMIGRADARARASL